MGNVGERLQQARIRAGLSLADVSARTKIRATLLEAIERADFRPLPQGILGRGCLRAYAREVGLDPESVVRECARELESEATDAALTHAAAAAAAARERARAHRRSRRLPPAAAALAGLTGALLIVFTPPPATDEAVSANPIAPVDAVAEVAVVHDAPEEADVPAADPVAAAVAAPDAPALTLTISPAGVVWVEATADATRVLERLVYPGDDHVIDAREEIVVRVGDAGAFDYSINGRRGRQVGPAGSVRTLRITRENHTTFQEP